MSTDEYVPTIQSVRDGYVWLSAEDNPIGRELAGEDFDRFLARVRRDAAREALDGLAKAELDRVANLGKHSYPAQIAQGIAQAAWNHKWKNYGGAHPEETP